MDTLGTNMCAYFDDDRLWNEKALVLGKSYNNTEKNDKKNNIRGHWDPFSGPKNVSKRRSENTSLNQFLSGGSSYLPTGWLLGRPYGVTGGLIKCSWCFLFFQRVISELPRPITAKLRHMIGTKKLAPKKLGAKNMQNFGRFHTTSDFDREYLWNGSRYPKSEN